jgi:hypothetical protein
MPRCELFRLSKDEKNVLFYFIKNQIMQNSRPIEIVALLRNIGTVYDTSEMQTILTKLTQEGYLKQAFETIPAERKSMILCTSMKLGEIKVRYGIKDRATYDQLCRDFKCRFYQERILAAFKSVWYLIVEHFREIVAAAIIAFLTYLYLQSPLPHLF